jgi:hypothetical protein
MSGFFAPLRTATPAPERTKSVRLPAATFPAFTRSSMMAGVVMTISACASSFIFPGSTAPE